MAKSCTIVRNLNSYGLSYLSREIPKRVSFDLADLREVVLNALVWAFGWNWWIDLAVLLSKNDWDRCVGRYQGLLWTVEKRTADMTFHSASSQRVVSSSYWRVKEGAWTVSCSHLLVRCGVRSYTNTNKQLQYVTRGFRYNLVVKVLHIHFLM